MFLDGMDGCSCGSTAVTYKPIEFDGQRLISTNLNSRTLRLDVSFSGRNGALYSRSAAIAHYNEIQRVLVPGQMGTLTWTDGDNSRFIRCRCSETPLPTEVLPFLFRASIQLIADIPLWYDGNEETVTLDNGGTVTIDNDCGIPVPVMIDVDPSSDLFVVVNNRGGGLGFVKSISGGFTIDTGNCTVISDGGEYVNNQLDVDSEFFKLMPGNNVLVFAGQAGVTIRWRRAFMGVY